MIPIKNVYYMLTYAFNLLNEQGYKDLATEDFSDAKDLMAAIIVKGTSMLIKKGFTREYLLNKEETSTLKGKINITDSIKNISILRNKMVCSFDDFSLNCIKNRVIKTTMLLLLRNEVKEELKNKLKKNLIYFKDVSVIDLDLIDWHFRYTRNDETYRMLLSICYLIKYGMLESKQDGNNKLMDYINDKQMFNLYEKFILEYYKKEYPKLSANASYIPWQLDDGVDTLLPIMRSDITLSYKNKILIIDAKFYTHTTQFRYNTNSLISANLYQIFTYVKNKQYEVKDNNINVSGMLLYAKTDEEIIPNNIYHMSGNTINVRTLDLEADFALVKKQLNDIVAEYFNLF